MRKLLSIFLLLIIFSTTVFAEEMESQSGPAEPNDTDIILPEMYLEVEDLSIEEIDAAIPDDDSVVFMAIEIPLPKPGEINLPPEVFTLPASDVPVNENFENDSTSLYCEGIIGAGTSANITGDINLYHIGSQPNFRLRYFHDGYDGFAGKEAGMGFLSREELIEAELGLTLESLEIEALVTYNEIEDGLQGLANYYSMTRRVSDLDANIDWIINDKFKLGGGLNLEYTGNSLNSEQQDPLAYHLFSVKPNAIITFNYKAIKTSFEVDYYFGSEISEFSNQSLSTNLSFGADFFNYLKINSKVGLLWDNFKELQIPFFVSVSGTGSLLYYSVSGGREYNYSNWSELWTVFPAGIGPINDEVLGLNPLSDRYYAEGEIKVNLSEDFTIFTKLDFSYAENALKPGGISQLKGFSSPTTEESICFNAGAGFYWGISKIFALDLSWYGQLLEDINWFVPRNTFELIINVDAEDDSMGISMNACFNIYGKKQTYFDDSLVPKIGFEGYLTIYDGFMVSFKLSDILANAIDSGRVLWEGYFDKGTVFQVLVNISL